MSVNQPLVSILIPLYNQERYFEKCIRSVCNQTYKNLEIIVVNDGSTDKSPEILSKWASKDLRIKVIEKKNEGPSAARRDGFRHASGEFVTPVDSDDYIPGNAIEILAGHMVSKNVDLVQGSMAQIFGFIKRKHCYDGGSFPFHQVVSQPELFNKYYLNFFGKGFFSIHKNWIISKIIISYFFSSNFSLYAPFKNSNFTINIYVTDSTFKSCCSFFIFYVFHQF